MDIRTARQNRTENGTVLTFDILAALANDTAERGTKRCALARWLDDIPTDTEGRDELIRLVETIHTPGPHSTTMSAQRVAKVLTTLGHSTGQSSILDHRNHACACYR